MWCVGGGSSCCRERASTSEQKRIIDSLRETDLYEVIRAIVQPRTALLYMHCYCIGHTPESEKALTSGHVGFISWSFSCFFSWFPFMRRRCELERPIHVVPPKYPSVGTILVYVQLGVTCVRTTVWTRANAQQHSSVDQGCLSNFRKTPAFIHTGPVSDDLDRLYVVLIAGLVSSVAGRTLKGRYSTSVIFEKTSHPCPVQKQKSTFPREVNRCFE